MRVLPSLLIRIVLNPAENHSALLIVEESSPGGFSAHVLQFLATEGCLDGALKIRCASLPDSYLDHAERDRQLAISGLDVEQLCATARGLVLPQKQAEDAVS